MIKIYGVQRTGTTWLRELLRQNTTETILMHEFGWKHGEAQPFQGIPGNAPMSAIVIVKHPWNWIRSIMRWHGGHEKTYIEQFGYAKHYNKMYRHYADFLSLYWPYMGYDKVTFVRYEDLLRSREEKLRLIGAALDINFNSFTDVKKVENSEAFSEEKRQSYLMPEPIEDCGIDWRVFKFFGYREEK